MLTKRTTIAASTTVVTVAAAAVTALMLTGTAADAARLLTGADIRNGSLSGRDITNGSVSGQDITNGTLKGKDIKNGSVAGKDIKDGSLGLKDLDSSTRAQITSPAGGGFAGAYYSVAFYNAGITESGAIASVSCKSTGDTAVSGGVQVTGIEPGANARNTPVSSSFPGRMDWSTFTPIPGRLDGWIIQFGGNAGAVPDKDPEKVKVWALCVPGLDIPIEQTYTEAP